MWDPGTGRNRGKRERGWEYKLDHHLLFKGCVIHMTADTPGRSGEPRFLLSHCCSGEPYKADAKGNAHPRAQIGSDVTYVYTCSSLVRRDPGGCAKMQFQVTRLKLKLGT